MTRLRPRWLGALLAVITLGSTPALGQNARAAAPTNGDEPPPITAPRKALAITTAIVPGLIAHGTGHLVAGQHRTGLRLLGLEAAGAGLAIGGIGGIAAAGASRRFMGPLVTATVAGGALFAISLLADLYGVLAPEGGTGSPPRYLPSVETQLGFAYVYDRIFDYRAFLVPGMDLRLGSVRLSGLGFFALGDTNARTRAELAYRFLGPKPKGNAPAADGSYLEAELALTNHSFTSNGFAVTTGEVNVAGRLDLAHVGPTLRGSFAELGVGFAYAVHRYEGIDYDVNDLLTPRFGFGIYLGHVGWPRGEAMAYYEHRHDPFAAGLEIPGLASGMAGHFGLKSRLWLSPRWGISADAQAGSAYLGRLSLLFRHGGMP